MGLSGESGETVVHLAQTLIVALLILGRWMQAREGGEKVTAAQLAEVKTSLSSKVHTNDLLALQRLVDDICERVDQKADASTSVTEATILKLLEHDRHETRKEFDGKLQRCITKDRYDAEHKTIAEQLGILWRKAFNGGFACV